MLGDLHLYTGHPGDSERSAEALVAARGRGLDYASFVERDTTEGAAHAISIGLRLGIAVIPGVKVSGWDHERGRAVDVLGYNYRIPAANVEALCRPMRETPGGGRVDARDVVRAIVADGGVAVLARPGVLDSWEMVPALVDAGLRGIELSHPGHSPADQARVRQLAGKHNLIMTGGSADGGDHSGVRTVGDICAPAGALEALTRSADPEIAWAADLTREAGAMARQAVAEEADVQLKGGDIKDLVTEHDVAIDRHLVAAIRERFPGHGFLTEEHDQPQFGDTQPFWVIDPIDGTTNFVTRRDYFAISIAHYHGDVPQFGIVYDVMADELYLGVAGEGAWLNGVRLPRLGTAGGAADGRKPLADCVIECSLNAAFDLRRRYGVDEALLARAFRATRSNGSAAIGICRIARDTLDVYLSSNLAVWDYAAAVIVLREVGGDWDLVGRGSSERASVSPETINNEKVPFLAARDRSVLAEVMQVAFPG